MPTILSIETSSEIASAALLIGTQVIERQTSDVTKHSQAILPMVQSVLAEAGIALSACDAIAFGSGPGAFTGVRTACGVVQGLAFGADLPVIPVITLLALAEACRHKHGAVDVVAALDARMSEVYWAQYHFDSTQQTWQTVVAPALCAPGLVVPSPRDELRSIGNGFAAYPDAFTWPALNGLPEASFVARLAQVEFAAGRMYSAEQAQPFYLRNKIAQTIAERQSAALS